MNELIIVGAGGFGREVLQFVKDINYIKTTWNIKGFLDDNANALDNYECDYRIIGSIRDWKVGDNEKYALAISDPSIKEKVVHLLVLKGAEFVSIIHPTATIGSFNRIGKGIVMYPNSRIIVNVSIGDYVTILDNSSIGHDSIVGNYSTICGNCSINGNVKLGNKVFFGTHVSTVPGKIVGDGAYVGAGSVIMTDIKENCRVFGVPARKLTP